MSVRPATTLSILSLAVLTCGLSDPPSTTGTVRGAVADSSGAPVSGCTACIEGTNLCAPTDSTGAFRIFSVPEGAWRLVVGEPIDTAFTVDVSGDEVTDVGTLAQPGPGCGSTATQFAIFDAHDSGAIAGPWYISDPCPTVRAGRTTVMYRNVDSILLGVKADPQAGPVSILYNGELVCDDCSPKGRLLGEELFLLRSTGNDTIVYFSLADAPCPATAVLLSEACLDSFVSNRVLITTGTVTLGPGPCALPSMNVMLDSQYYCIGKSTIQKVDWDIYFINDATGDTCCWSNRTPCWDPACRRSPVFAGDVCQVEPGAFGAWAQLACANVSGDLISADSLADGEFSIYVNYFHGPDDSGTATPTLIVELGRRGPSNYVERMYTASPSKALHKGETWYAGKVLLPDRRYVPADSVVPSGLGRRIKQR